MKVTGFQCPYCGGVKTFFLSDCMGFDGHEGVFQIEGSFQMFADLVGQRKLMMSCRGGRAQPVIFWVVLIIFNLPYQVDMQYASTLSLVQQ